MSKAIIPALAAAALVAGAAHGATRPAAAPRASFSRSAMDFVRDEIHVGINIGNTLDVPSVPF
ncbi:MAG: hypothetical protein ILM98_06330, partial [Kiritimatiellae bacterium]|nr:hypothetical protein [Kiritimatiellia bacterium]